MAASVRGFWVIGKSIFTEGKISVGMRIISGDKSKKGGCHSVRITVARGFNPLAKFAKDKF